MTSSKSNNSNARRRLRLTGLIVFISSLILSFQNCGGSFDAASTSDRNASSLSAATGGASGSTAGTTGPAPGSPEAEAARIAACKGLMGVPSIDSITNNDILMNVGAGTSESGDTSNATATMHRITVTRNISDLTKANDLACGFQTVAECSLDTTKTITITKAINNIGVDESIGATTAQKNSIAESIISRGNCNGNLPGSLTDKVKDFRFTPNRPQMGGYFCVQGEATVKISYRNQIDNNNRSSSSSAVFVRVRLGDTCWNESKLKATATFPGASKAGEAVAIDGQWAAVLATEENLASNLSIDKVGAAYMFQKVSGVWTFKEKIQVPGSIAKDALRSVALKGQRLVLGTQRKSNYRGSVFVYTYNGNSWAMMQEILPSDTADGQRFGMSVAMNDNTLVVGAPTFSTVAGAVNEAGRVYVFNCTANSTCTPTPRLTIDGHLGGGLGTSLSLDGNTLAVGAPGTESTAVDGMYGSVKVYDITAAPAVIKKTIIANEVSSVGIRFGLSVAIQGTKLAVGAPDRNADATNLRAGAVFYYDNYAPASGAAASASTALAPLRKFTGAKLNAAMGFSVAMSSTGLFVGCKGCASRVETAGGSVRFYKFTTLETAATTDFFLFPLDETPTAQYGASVAASGNDVIIGSMSKANPDQGSGAAYINEMK